MGEVEGMSLFLRGVVGEGSLGPPLGINSATST